MAQSAALRVMKNAAALSVARVSVPLFSFILVIYAARFLGVNGFGKFVLVQTYFLLFLGLCSTALGTVVTREIARSPLWVNRYLSASVVLVSILALLSNGVMIILIHLLHFTHDTQLAINLAGLALLPTTISFMFQSAFVAFEKAEYVTYGTVLENTVRVLLSLAALFRGYGIVTLFLILCATRTFSLLFYLIFLNKQISKLRWHFERAFFVQLVRNWKTFALENWVYTVFFKLDVVFLSFFHGAFAVGIYGAAYKVLHPGTVVGTSFATAFFPYMSRTFEQSKATFRRINKEVINYMLVIILPGAVTIAFLADHVILLLYTGSYADAIPILRVLIWVLVLMSFNLFMTHILFAQGEQWKALRIAVVTLASYVAICFWFIPRWGGIGAACALLLALGAAFGLYLVAVFRREGAMHTLSRFGRTFLATIGFGVFILVLRDVHLVLLLSSAVALYVLLLLLFRVLSSRDVAFFRAIFLRGFRRIGAILGRV